jgi:nucleoside-diphosphate-sugar epimerase
MTKSKSNSQTVWITGCAGFLGRRLATYLHSRGYNVVGLSRRPCPEASRSLEIDLAAPGSQDRLEELATETDGYSVVHAASRQPVGGNLSDFIDSNIKTTENLLDAISAKPPEQLIYTSTLAVYNKPVSLPVRETTPASGTLPYSATKRWAEELLRSFQGSARVTVLRLPSLYGAGQADSFVDGLAKLALQNESLELFSKGQVIRDALHVTDVLTAIESAIARPQTESYSVMNLGCGKPVKVIEYATALVEALGSKSRIELSERQSPHADLYADIGLARKTIGFEPATLERAMTEYVKELRA